ncbi:MAG: TolC family protein [archaeon]
MKIHKITCLIFLFVVATHTPAQVITLDSVLNAIEQNHPMLKMYEAQIRAIDDYSQMSKSWMPPTISVGPWQARYDNVKDGMWMTTVEQMIPNPIKQKASYNFMRSMSFIEAKEKKSKRNEMFAMAKQNYFEWVILKKKFAVLAQTDSLLTYIVKVAQSRYPYSKEKLNNIYKAQADLYELHNMETMLTGEMRMKNIELNSLMNFDESRVFDIDTVIQIPYYEIQSPDTSAILASRSDIQFFDASINLIRLQQKFEKTKSLPDISISFSHMNDLNNMANRYSLMGMISFPFVPWASKEYKSNIRSLNSKINALRYMRQALLVETTGMIASLQTSIQSTRAQLQNYKENIIPTYYKSYQSSLLAYEQNTEDLFVVLDGLKMLRMAMMNELDQLNTLLKLQVDYEKQMEIR